jgi:hypothetical protein
MFDLIIGLFSWKTWIFIFIIILIIMWLIFGGQHHQINYSWVQRSPLHQVNYSQVQYQPQIPNIELVGSPRHRIDERPVIADNIDAIVPPQFEPNYTIGRSIGEQLTCGIMEELLGRRVERNIRLPHMINPRTGRRLEYDCYDPVDGIAAEYNGKQHYVYDKNSPFNQNQEQFEDLVYRDQLKWELSNLEEYKTYLIVVPYVIDMCVSDVSKPTGYKCKTSVPRQVRYQRIKDYLTSQLSDYYQLLNQPEGL